MTAIRTPDDLRDRCEVMDTTGCWLWRGCVVDGKPRVHTHDFGRGKGRTMLGTLAAWQLAHRARPPEGMIVRRGCTQRLCVNPEHMVLAKHISEVQRGRTAGSRTVQRLHGFVVVHDAHVQERAAYCRRWLAARCEDDGDCLLWRMCVDKGGAPVASVQGGRIRVRTWVHACTVGAVPAGMELTTSCGNARCMAHLVMVTTAERIAMVAERGGYSTPARRAANRRSGAARQRYSADVVRQARELFAQGMSSREIAAQLGVSPQSVSEWCLGRRRTDVAPNASVFSWRPAA